MTKDTIQTLESGMHEAVVHDEIAKMLPVIRLLFKSLPYHDQAISMTCLMVIAEKIAESRPLAGATHDAIFENYIDNMRLAWATIKRRGKCKY